MFVDSARNTMALAARLEKGVDSNARIVMQMRQQASLFLLENREAMPTGQDYEEVAEFFTEITEVQISPAHAEAILALYPQARIKVAMDGVVETDVRSDLSYAAAHFFLGCHWPTYEDVDVDIETFVEVLKTQAVAMGFELAEPDE